MRRTIDLYERERRLLAYDLHDGAVQYLTAALLQFESCGEMQSRQGGETEKAWKSGLDRLRLSIVEMRRLIGGLQPALLDECGVIAAVETLIWEHRTNGDPEIEFHHDVGFNRLAPPLENTLFRIVQEAVSNACRHSRSKMIRVALVQRGRRVRAEVRDWGVGFDLAGVDKGRFGLRGIRERARLFGGHASIESVPGAGTRIVVHLPVVENDAV